MKRAIVFMLAIGAIMLAVALSSCTGYSTCPTYSKGSGKEYNARRASMERKLYWYKPSNPKK